MGTPTTIDILVPKRKITTEEWQSLVEARRDLIAPHLKHFTLRALEDVPCFQGMIYEHGLSHDPEVVLSPDSQFQLSTQGIFSVSQESFEVIPNSRVEKNLGNVVAWSEDGLVYIWGLTRSLDWITARIKFREAGGDVITHIKAYEVTTDKVDFETLMVRARVTPLEVLKWLRSTSILWKENRERLLKDAQMICSQICIEDDLIEYIDRD